MTRTQHQLRQYLGSLGAILRNYGAIFPVPMLERYETGGLGFSFQALLPGPQAPRPPTMKLAEIWQPAGAKQFRRREYAFDFIDYPLNRRRAFHGHDPDYFAREFGVLVHEHCEERLGAPACTHYYGLPVDGYEAIEEFARLWAQPSGALDCASLRCME